MPPKRIKTLVNAETGERTAVEATKRVKEWYWVNDEGKINLSVRYGAKVLELAKGKNAIELASGDELMATLNTLKTAVLAGELDEQIEELARKKTSALMNPQSETSKRPILGIKR